MLVEMLQTNKKPLMFAFEDRPKVDSLSATAFVRAVKSLKERENTTNDIIQTIRPYIPQSLSEKDVLCVWDLLVASKHLK